MCVQLVDVHRAMEKPAEYGNRHVPIDKGFPGAVNSFSRERKRIRGFIPGCGLRANFNPFPKSHFGATKDRNEFGVQAFVAIFPTAPN